MSVIRRNVLANVAGRGWTAVLALAVVPVYLRVLGIEAYGLIGFYLSLAAVLALLDLGLGTAINRQLAQYSTGTGHEQEMRDIVRTLEVIYWLVAIVIAAAMAALAPWLAGDWLQRDRLPVEDVEQTLALMGVAIACQWPKALYAGGLTGLQRLVPLNAISIAFTTVQNIGAVLVLWWVSPTLQAFMLWHIGVGLAETVATGAMLWRALPPGSGQPVFRVRLLARMWRFAAGMAGISATSVILTQLDKVILSRILPLDAYGYYILAWRVAGALYYIVAPISAAFFPRFSQLAAARDETELARLYHRGCQLIAVAVVPAVAMLVLFPRELLWLWTHDADAARNGAALVALLALGSGLNSLMYLPLAVQLAYGSTRLVLYANTACVAVLGPLIYYVTLRHGAAGAAAVWVLLNAGYVLFLLRAMHRRLLRGELRRWIYTDTLKPSLAAFAAAAAFDRAVSAPDGGVALLAYLVCAGCAALLAALALAPQMRALALHRWHTGRAVP